MVFHYINLKGWKVILESNLNENDRLFADSAAISILASFILGKKIKRNSGPSSFKKLMNNKVNYCVICSKNSDFTHNKSNFFVAPEKIKYPFEFGQKLAPKLSNYEYICTGISTPKQNLIAKGIASINVNAKIFTYGAVIDDLILERKIPQVWQNFGFEWLYRFKFDFKRGVSMFSINIVNILKILTIKSYRDSFLRLSKRLYIDQEYDYE